MAEALPTSRRPEPGWHGADPADPAAVFQTLLAADALRYLTLQTCGSKASGHPGGKTK